MACKLLILKGIYGAPGKTRTSGLLIRSQTLYPTELRVRLVKSGKIEYTGRVRECQARPKPVKLVAALSFNQRA